MPSRFGYTTIGATSLDIYGVIRGSVFTCPENGVAESISVALKRSDIGTATAKCAIYRHSDLYLMGITEEKTCNFPVSGTYYWFTFNFIVKPNLINEDYVLVVWAQLGASQVWVAYTAGDPNQGHTGAYDYNSFPDPIVFSHNTRKHSIYCDYSIEADIQAEFIVQLDDSIDLPAEFRLTQEALLAKFIVQHNDSEDLQVGFIVRKSNSLSIPSKLIVRHSDSLNLPAEFYLTQEDLFAEFIVRHSDSEEIQSTFIIRHSDTKDLQASFVARHSNSEIIPSEFIVRHSDVKDLQTHFVVRHSDSLVLQAGFIVRHSAIRDLQAGFQSTYWKQLQAGFIVRHTDIKTIPSEFIVRHSDSEEIQSTFVVRHSDSQDLVSEIIVRHTDLQDLPSEFIIRHSNSEELLSEFISRQAATTQDLQVAFIVRHTTSLALFASFKVRHSVDDWRVWLKSEFRVNQEAENLKASFKVRKTGVSNLQAEFIPIRSTFESILNNFKVRQSLESELKAIFETRHDAIAEIIAEFQIENSADLFAHFNAFSGYLTPLVVIRLDNILTWINLIECRFRGFIDAPLLKNSLTDKVSGINALKITSARGEGRYKEIRFGWRYDGDFLDYSHGIGIGANLLAAFIIRHQAISTMFAHLIVRHSSSQSLLAEFFAQKAAGSGYFNMEGKILLQEWGAYIAVSGTGALYVDSPEGWGGAYFNRS